MSKTRYIRLVDRQPTQTGYTGVGNVASSIEVSMDLKTAFSASERRSITVPLIDMPTQGAFLRGVSGIDKYHRFTKIFRFIPNKPFKFVKRPIVQFSVKIFTSSFLYPDLRKVFKSKYCVIRINNLLRDTVINVSHKPSLSSRHFTEFSFGRSSAFGLKFRSKVSELGTGVFHKFGIVKCVVRADSDVNDSPVNSKYIDIVGLFRCRCLKLAMQIKCFVTLSERYRRRLNFPVHILMVIPRNCKHRFNSSITGSNGCVSGFHIDSDNSLVVSHCRKFFTEWFKFTFCCFKSFTCTISCTLYQRRRKIRNSLSNIAVRRIMTSNFAARTGIKSPFSTNIKCYGVIFHCMKKKLSFVGSDINLQRDSPNHSHIYDVIVEKTYGGAIPPTTEVVGLLAY